MKLQVYNKTSEIPASLAAKLRSLTFRESGLMRDTFQDMRRGTKQGKVAVLFEGDQVISWGILFNTEKTSLPEAHCYTRKSHRRQGHGIRVMSSLRIPRNTKVDEGWYGTKDIPHGARASFWIKVKHPKVATRSIAA